MNVQKLGLVFLGMMAMTSCACGQSGTAVKSSGLTSVSATINGVTVSAKMRTSVIDVGAQGQERHTAANLRCTFSRLPCSLVDSLEISVAGHAVWVPRTLEVMLSDVNSATIRREGSRIVLYLTGGDASEA